MRRPQIEQSPIPKEWKISGVKSVLFKLPTSIVILVKPLNSLENKSIPKEIEVHFL